MAAFTGDSNVGPAEHVVYQEDQDNLWRCFSLYCLQGSATDSLRLRMHSFIKFVRDCRFPPSAGFTDVAVTVIYRRHATGNVKKKCMNTRLINSQRVRKKAVTKLGQHMRYDDFVHALADMGVRLYRFLGKAEALSRIVFEYVLPNAHSERTHLPFSMSDKMVHSILSDPHVVNFMDEWDEMLLEIFNRCRPPTAPRAAGEHRWMLYLELQEFCETYLWLHTHHTTSLLSKYQIAQIFVVVKHGAGTGVMPGYMSYSEFRTALVLLAFAAAESERRQHPAVYVSQDSNSSASQANIHSHKFLHEHKEFDPKPVSKLKWLLKRIYDCSERRDKKTQWLTPFKKVFQRMHIEDGKPVSYLAPNVEISQKKRRSTITVLSSPPKHSVGSGSDWIELKTAEGQLYYFQKSTNKVQWEKPEEDLVRIKGSFRSQPTNSKPLGLTRARRPSMLTMLNSQMSFDTMR